jgi:hypothetical protein
MIIPLFQPAISEVPYPYKGLRNLEMALGRHFAGTWKGTWKATL